MEHAAKSLLAGCVVSACLATAPAFAQGLFGRMETGLYLGAGVGQSRSEFDTTGFSGSVDERDTGWKVFGGYQFHRNFAVEAGYYDLGKNTFNGTTTVAVGPFPAGTAFSGRVRTRAGAVSALGILPLGNAGFSVFGRLGVSYAKQKVNATLGGLAGSADDETTQITYGLGARFDFTRNLGVRAEWERFRVGGDDVGGKNDVDLFTANLVYRF